MHSVLGVFFYLRFFSSDVVGFAVVVGFCIAFLMSMSIRLLPWAWFLDISLFACTGTRIELVFVSFSSRVWCIGSYIQ